MLTTPTAKSKAIARYNKTMTLTEHVLLNASLNGDHNTVHQILLFLRPDTAEEMNPAVVDALFKSVSEQLKTAPSAELKVMNQSFTIMRNIKAKTTA